MQRMETYAVLCSSLLHSALPVSLSLVLCHTLWWLVVPQRIGLHIIRLSGFCDHLHS